MLKIHIPESEQYDSVKNEFFTIKEQTLTLEHSLVSISKWESKFCKPFLSNEKKTTEETIYYIKCMTLTQNVDPNVYLSIPSSAIKEINEYIESPMTATWFTEHGPTKPVKKEVITSELIYYWMVALEIPFECQKWHLNRLLTLIKVCNAKNQPPKKMSKHDVMSRNTALNMARRKAVHSKG